VIQQIFWLQVSVLGVGGMIFAIQLQLNKMEKTLNKINDHLTPVVGINFDRLEKMEKTLNKINDHLTPPSVPKS
jgi:hypothetical protein